MQQTIDPVWERCRSIGDYIADPRVFNQIGPLEEILSPGSTFCPIVILAGPEGSGKKALAHGLVSTTIPTLSREGEKVITRNAGEWQISLVEALKNRTIKKYRSWLLTPQVLIITGIQILRFKTETRQQLMEVISSRLEQSKATLLTLQAHGPLPQELLTGALSKAKVIRIPLPGFYARRALVLRKASQLGMDLPQNGVVAIADQIITNMNLIESLLRSLPRTSSGPGSRKVTFAQIELALDQFAGFPGKWI